MASLAKCTLDLDEIANTAGKSQTKENDAMALFASRVLFRKIKLPQSSFFHIRKDPKASVS